MKDFSDMESLDELSPDEVTACAITNGSWTGSRLDDAPEHRPAPLIAKDETGESIAMAMDSSAINVEVHVSKLGVRRKVKASRTTVDGVEVSDTGGDGTIAAEHVGVSKKLISCVEYSDIVTLDGQFYVLMMSRVLSCKNRKGVYMLPTSLIDWFEAQVAYYVNTRNNLIDIFLGVYRERVEDARVNLGPLFDEKEYPTAMRVRESFSVTRDYGNVGVPDRLAAINPSLFERERAKRKQHLVAEALEIRAAMRQSLLTMVEHLQDLMVPHEGGRKKRLAESTVENLATWLELFEARNLTSDVALSGAVEQVRRTMAGVDVKDLRKDESLRDAIGEELGDAAELIGSMVREAPKRAFNFDM